MLASTIHPEHLKPPKTPYTKECDAFQGNLPRIPIVVKYTLPFVKREDIWATNATELLHQHVQHMHKALMCHISLGKISLFQSCCHMERWSPGPILLNNSCSTCSKSLTAIITLGHENDPELCQLKRSYQAPLRWDVLESPGLFAPARWTGLGRPRGS